MSFVSNSFDICSRIRDLRYSRRFRAEVSYGIGNWMGCLENLCQLGIIINCAGIYFTSKIYHKIFIQDYKFSEQHQQYHKDGLEPDYRLNTGWDTLKFFMFIVVVEHVILIVKLVSEQVIDEDISDYIQKGERDRQQLKDKYHEMNE